MFPPPVSPHESDCRWQPASKRGPGWAGSSVGPVWEHDDSFTHGSSAITAAQKRVRVVGPPGVPHAVRTSSTRPWPHQGYRLRGPSRFWGALPVARYTHAPLWEAARAPWRSTTSSSRPGGSDFDLDRLVALCPACHAQTDAPYARPANHHPLGGGQFTCEVTRAADTVRAAAALTRS